MRRNINIDRGEIVLMQGREHTFHCCLPSGDGKMNEPDLYQFLDRRTFRAVVLTLQELEEQYANGEIKFKREYEHPGDRLPDENSHDAVKRRVRQHYLKEYDACPVTLSDRKLNGFVAQAKDKLGIPCDWSPSAGALRRWIKERGESGDRRLRFMGDRYQSGSRASRIHPVAQEILAEKAEAFWTDRRVTATDVWNNVVAELASRNPSLVGTSIRRPSLPTVWRYLNRHMNFDRACSRLGTRAAQRRYQPIKDSLKTDAILEVVQFDHTTLDCWVLDDELGIPIGRPHLALLLDVHSRYPLAFHIGFAPPSLLSVHACLRQAVRPKGWIKERFPSIHGDWIAYGTPRTILVDNAWESSGSSFVDACEDAGISIEWAPVRTPEYKGAIERIFGTVNKQLIHKLKGSVPFKPQQMQELGIDPMAETILFLSDLQELICQYFIEVYGRDVHRTLNASPEQVWREREKIDGIDFAGDLASLDASFGTLARDRTLSREGIILNGLTYCSEDVHQLLVDLIPIEKKRNRVPGTAKVKVKHYPEDISRISVWNEPRKTYVELPCTNQKYAAGLTQHHHKVLTEWAKQQNLEFQTEKQCCLAKSRLAERIHALVPARIRDRKRLQRLKPQIMSGDTVLRRTIDSLDTIDPSRRSQYEVPITTVSNRADGRMVEKTPPRGGSRRGRRSRSETPAHVIETTGKDIAIDEGPVDNELINLLIQARQARSG